MNWITALGIALQCRLPSHLIGAPGIGKTKVVGSFGKALGLHVETLVAATRDRTDFGGIPYPTVQVNGLSIAEAKVHLLHLPWVERVMSAPSILFLDELGSAPVDVKPALLRILLERVVGDTQLPETTRVLAASNPQEWGEGEGPESWSLAMRTRLVHIEASPVSAEAFATAMVAGWKVDTGLPSWEAIQATLPAARSLVGAFVRRHPEALAPLPKPGQQFWGWPNPRTWETYAVPSLAAWLATNRSPKLEGAISLLLAGAVGPYGGSFLSWVGEQNLPDPEEILLDPTRAEVPSRVDQIYVVIGAVSGSAHRETTPARWEAAWKYFHRFPRDMMILGARQLVQLYKDRGLAQKGYSPPDWIKELLPLLGEIEEAKR